MGVDDERLSTKQKFQRHFRLGRFGRSRAERGSRRWSWRGEAGNTLEAQTLTPANRNHTRTGRGSRPGSKSGNRNRERNRNRDHNNHLTGQIRDSFYDLLELRQLEAGERYARQAAAWSASAGGGAAANYYGATSAAVGRFGRWRGPTGAEQLAAVSHYAKYADYVPVLSASQKANLEARRLRDEAGPQGLAGQQQEQQQQAAGHAPDLSRTSLLGRPLKVETHHRDLRYRKKQNIIYNFLERPRGWRAALYHFLL